MNRLHRYLLWFLVVDLAFSALALVWLLGARRGELMVYPSGVQGQYGVSDDRAPSALPLQEIGFPTEADRTAASPGAVNSVSPVTAVGAPDGEASDANRQAELQALLRDIQAAQVRIDAELDRQAQIVGEEAFRTEVKVLSLTEFQELFPEEYENYEIKREFNMRNAKMFVSKRERALSLLRPEGLTAEEYATLRTVYEYLLECDQNMLEGRPVKPLPEGLPERAELEALVENYARQQSGCTPEMLDTWQAIQDFELGTYFVPYFVMDKSVVYREDQ